MSNAPFYIPRVDPQLQNGQPTAGDDCSVMVGKGGIRWATADQTNPTVKAIREFVGKPTGGGLDMGEMTDAYQHYGCDATFVRDLTSIRAALADGHFVHAAVGYGWLVDNAYRLAGDKDFRGGHGVGLFGLEEVLAGAGPRWVYWLDPLHDGRRPSIPKQPIMVRFGRFAVPAMQAFSGGVQAIIVKRGW